MSKHSEQISEAIDKFNNMLHSGKHSREECYSYLYNEKAKIENNFYKEHGFFMDMGFSFLYPERFV